jgi:hypothetical protein
MLFPVPIYISYTASKDEMKFAFDSLSEAEKVSLACVAHARMYALSYCCLREQQRAKQLKHRDRLDLSSVLSVSTAAD